MVPTRYLNETLAEVISSVSGELVIREAQESALAEARRLDFRRRCFSYLAQKYPQCLLSNGEEGLYELIDESWLHTQEHHISTEEGVVTWAELVLHYGSGFVDDQTWASYILNNPELDTATRVSRLMRYIPFGGVRRIRNA